MVVAKELPSAWIIAPEQLDHLRLPPPHLSREVDRYNLVVIFMIRSACFQKLNPKRMRVIVIQYLFVIPMSAAIGPLWHLEFNLIISTF